jgi:hypothetical protein
VSVVRDYQGDIRTIDGPARCQRGVVSTIPVPRIRYLARRIHLLGERPLAELFIELAAGGDLHGVLERYARLAPAADFIRAFGGDRLTAPRALSGDGR